MDGRRLRLWPLLLLLGVTHLEELSFVGGRAQQRQPKVAAGSSGTDGTDVDGASLVAACRDGDLVQLQMMLASGVSPDAQDADGQRPLCYQAAWQARVHRECCKARRLDQWPDPKGSGFAQSLSGQSGESELLSLARLVLELIAAVTQQVHQASQDDSSGGTGDFNQSQSQKDGLPDKEKHQKVQRNCVKAACLAVRKKLDFMTVAFAVRESVSSLLYVVVMAESKQAGQLVGGGKGQLAESIYQICGLRDSVPGRQSETFAPGSAVKSKEPCGRCKCCHITIQEALSLLQFLHKSLCGEGNNSIQEQISKHVEDGIVLLLQILIQLSSQLHEGCYLAAHRASSQFGWRTLYEEIRQKCTLVSWPHMFAWTSFERSLQGMEISFAKLERRVALLELQERRLQCRMSRCVCPSAGFLSFPPALPKVDVVQSQSHSINSGSQIAAASLGRAPLIHELLKANAEVDAPNQNGATALIAAAFAGDVDTIAALLNGKASVEASTASGVTALQAAVEGNKSEAVEQLLAAGAEVNTADVLGATPLHRAAQFGLPDIAAALLEANAQVDLGTNEENLTPLMMAARTGQSDVMAELLEAGADMEMREKKGGTALFEAAKFGATEAASLLLALNASADATREDGATPLMIAAQGGKAGVVLQLLNNTANNTATVDLARKDGCTALMFAAMSGHGPIVTELMKAGADPDTDPCLQESACHGCTPIHAISLR
eukprot:s29_g45.t2